MQYCDRCGSRLVGDKCHKCGKSYEVHNMDIVKNTVNKQMTRHGIRLPSTPRLVIILAIVAIAVLLSYIIFSNDKSPDTTSVLSRVQSQATQPVKASSVLTTAQAASQVIQKPSLRVYHQMVNQLGGNLGCFGRVDGGITNTGSVDAYGIILTCTAEDVSTQKDIGTIKAGDTQTFEVILNYNCAHMRTEECTATCTNC